MRILISSKHTLIPAGMQQMLSDVANKVITHIYHTTEQFIAKAILEQVDIAFLDKSGADIFLRNDLKEIRQRLPRLKIVMLSSADNAEFIQQVFNLGIDGYLTYDCTQDEVEELIRSVQSGNQYICQKALSMLIPKIGSVSAALGKTLTVREMEIARLIANGLTNKLIGAELNISPHTVHTHRKSMMKKLNVSSAREITLFILGQE